MIGGVGAGGGAVVFDASVRRVNLVPAPSSGPTERAPWKVRIIPAGALISQARSAR